MSEITKIIGNRIKEHRSAKNISQEELAHRADMHPSHLGQIERGEKSPTIDSLHKIICALDIPFSEFFNLDIKPKKANESHSQKILAYLNAMTDEEQKDVYMTVKMLMKWKRKS